jgi:hypothetical protein
LETTFIFGLTSKYQSIASYKFWDKFKFASSLNFKEIQSFLKKSDKFSKIPCYHDIPEYKFILTRFYSNIGSSYTSGKNDLVQIISKIVVHLRVLYPPVTNSPLIQTGQGMFPSDLQTLYFDLSDMRSLTSKIREDMTFQR